MIRDKIGEKLRKTEKKKPKVIREDSKENRYDEKKEKFTKINQLSF